jgi:hypothetical protein
LFQLQLERIILLMKLGWLIVEFFSYLANFILKM